MHCITHLAHAIVQSSHKAMCMMLLITSRQTPSSAYVCANACVYQSFKDIFGTVLGVSLLRDPNLKMSYFQVWISPVDLFA